MTVYKRGLLPSIYKTHSKELRKLDEDLLRALNELNDNLSAILNTGISFNDNFDSVFVTYTSNAIANTEDTVTHTLGKTPTGIIPVSLDKAAIIYKSGSYTATSLLIKCNVASTTATLLVF